MSRLNLFGKKLPLPRFAMIMIAFLLVGFSALIILIGSQPPDSSTRDGSIEFVIATEELTSDEDLVISVSNATVYVPKDAINTAGTISITPLPPDLFSIADQTEWSRTLIVNVEYRNEKGTAYLLVTLAQPFQICFKVSDERWQDYINRPDEYQVQTYAEGQDPPRWEPLSMLTYPERNELCGQTDHFSLFALAIKKPGGTIPLVDVTPTPRPGTLFELLSDIYGPNGQPDGVYQP
ncbi:MAG: hypothetical protein JW963_16555 [Anaerolineales bacterium]|nr:hypothetical protein [Anaerolineales bacterium]